MVTSGDLDDVHPGALREELGRWSARAVAQRDALVRLTSHQVVNCEETPETLRLILEVSAATLGADRASIWRYNSARTALECINLHEVGAQRHSAGGSLDVSEHPEYFAALASDDAVVADDAINDPRTRELRDGYLRPLDIQSMIDAPLHFNGAVDGVLCHEQVGATRHWTTDERTFVVAVSNVISPDL